MTNRSLKIIWLKTGPLHPLDTGGKIRTANMLRELKKRHHLTYVALCPEGSDQAILRAANEYSHEQLWIPWREARKGTLRFFAQLLGNLFSPLPYVIQKYQSARMKEQIQHLQSAGKHDLIVCDFLTPSVNLPDNLSRAASRTLLFQHNVESLIWKRLTDNASGAKRLHFRSQWRRLERFEQAACRRAAAVVGVSEEDCRIMRDRFALTNVLGAVPTGVDTDYFAPNPAITRNPQTLVFLGSMDWMPNIDGVDFFLEQIFPLIRRKYPQVSVAIVGRNPPGRLRDLALRTPGVRVTGTVPDVRPYLGEAEVMIVPLRIGGGTRIKIFEGMAAGVPVVSTGIGAEGLPLKNGEHLFLADAPEEFASRVCELLAEPSLRRRIGENGLKLVQQQFSWQAAAQHFEQYCARALA